MLGKGEAARLARMLSVDGAEAGRWQGETRVDVRRERIAESAAEPQAALRAIAAGRDSGYQPSA